MYIDTHCHLHDEAFEDVNATCREYTMQGVSRVIDMACNLDSALIGKSLSERFESVYFGCGFHPSDVGDFSLDSLAKLEQLAHLPKCVAIGEIGLDFYWEGYDKQAQISAFENQIFLANKVNVPISIHMREATQETLEILSLNRKFLTNGGVLHCFSGSKETAKSLLDLGLYISFAGPVTFKNANKILDVVKYIPIDKILSETDSPYLSPHPYRGKLNTPKNIPIIVEKLASLRGEDLEVLKSQIWQNSKCVFKKLPVD